MNKSKKIFRIILLKLYIIGTILSITPIYSDKMRYARYFFLERKKIFLDNNLKPTKPKKYCPEGTIVKSLEFKKRKHKIKNDEYFELIKCNNYTGYIDHKNTRMARSYEELAKIKDLFFLLDIFANLFKGKYINPLSEHPLYFNYDINEVNAALVFLDSVIGPSDSFVIRFDLKKISQFKYELTNETTKLIVTRQKAGVYLKVIYDNHYNFMKYNNTFWKYYSNE